MPISGYFDVPFASAGTRVTLPDAVQPDNSVSYTAGYTYNYTLQPGASGYLSIEQTKMNQLFYDITSAIQLQQQGLPAPFITSTMNGGSPFSYAQYATVILAGIAYISLVSNNTTTPPSASWSQLNIAPNIFTGGVTTGTANAQMNATVSPTNSVFTAGESVVCTAGYTNTAAMTYSAGGETPYPARKNSGGGLIALTGGEVVLGNTITWTKSGTGSGQVWVLGSGGNLGTMAYLGISGNSGGNDGSGNYAPFIYNQASTTGVSKVYAASDWGNLIQRSNAGAAMTDTLPGTTGALPNGFWFMLKNTDGTGSDTVSVGSGGGITTGLLTGLSSLIIEPGELWIVESQGSAVYNMTRIGSSVLHSAPPQGDFKNLKITTTSVTQGTITDDALVVQDANGNTRRLTNINQSYSTGVVGNNGLDTGSLTPSSWLNEFVTFNPSTNSQGCLLSLSATAPTLPAGFTMFARVGASRVDSSSHLQFKIQAGRKVQNITGTNPTTLPIMASGTAGNPNTPTYVAIATGAFVPPTASRIIIVCAFNTGSVAQGIVAPNSNYGPSQSSTTNAPPVAYCSTTTGGSNTSITDMLLETANIYWASSHTIMSQIYCLGWEDNL